MAGVSKASFLSKAFSPQRRRGKAEIRGENPCFSLIAASLVYSMLLLQFGIAGRNDWRGTPMGFT